MKQVPVIEMQARTRIFYFFWLVVRQWNQGKGHG
jgi:hypothetical protein